MRLFEMYDLPPKGYQDLDDDNSSPRWQESRKAKLTLRQIRKLRKMLDVRSYERVKNLKKIQDQYGPQAQPGMGAGPAL